VVVVSGIYPCFCRKLAEQSLLHRLLLIHVAVENTRDRETSWSYSNGHPPSWGQAAVHVTEFRGGDSPVDNAIEMQFCPHEMATRWHGHDTL